MENNRLEQLKESLDATVFNHNPYDKKTEIQLIERVRKEVDRPQPGGDWMRTFFKPALSVIGVVAFCFALFFMINGNDNSFVPSDDPTTPAKEVPLSQQQIYDKMLHSEDYFQTARGSYQIEYNNKLQSLEFAVKHGENPAYYVRRTGDGFDQEMLYTKAKTITLFHEQKAFTETTNTKPIEPDDLPLQYLYPTPIAKAYFSDFETWEAEKVEEINDRKAVVIEGVENGNDQESIKLWMDEETGIILKMEVRKIGANKVFQSIEIADIELNEQIDEQKFTLEIPENYTDKNRVN